ncbi:MAG: NAD(P)H-dependent oxidoreductase subunit E [Deltaproteobacteria bacterium]|nr:NAD(P)H-dependent oxidoreductase subunit E [Deltaproteobacteria bacterium]
MTGISTDKRDTLLAMITEEQRTLGFVSKSSMFSMAQWLGIPVAEVYGVVTFHTFFSVKPQGKHVVRSCKSVPCHLKRSEMVASWIGDYLGVNAGETTPDGRFSFELTNCIGACDQSPAMLVDDVLYGDLNQERVAKILKSFD